MTLNNILPYINGNCEIHIWFKDSCGELIFNNKFEVCNFWESFEIEIDSIESLGEETIAISICLPKEKK